jgi:quinol-cytochrome oxidoreductase complex cytochrome b subunit
MADTTTSRGFFAARYDTAALAARMRARGVPRGLGGVPHLLTALALFLGAFEVVTGALLGLYYRPDTAAAHALVRHVVTNVPYGELFRALHARGGDLLVVTVWALVLATVLTQRHTRPRELAWGALVLTAFATLAEAFTGSVLPWSEQSAVAARVATETVGTLPLVGRWLRRVMLGGDETGAVTLARVWGFHAGVVPAAVTALLAGVAVHRAALRETADAAGRTMPFAPHFVLRAAAVCVAALLALNLLAVFAPPALGAEAPTRVLATTATQPPWYLLALHVALSRVPARVLGVPGGTVVVVGGAALALALLALPFLDRRGARWVRSVFILLAAALLGVTAHALQA